MSSQFGYGEKVFQFLLSEKSIALPLRRRVLGISLDVSECFIVNLLDFSFYHSFPHVVVDVFFWLKVDKRDGLSRSFHGCWLRRPFDFSTRSKIISVLWNHSWLEYSFFDERVSFLQGCFAIRRWSDASSHYKRVGLHFRAEECSSEIEREAKRWMGKAKARWLGWLCSNRLNSPHIWAGIIQTCIFCAFFVIVLNDNGGELMSKINKRTISSQHRQHILILVGK